MTWWWRLVRAAYDWWDEWRARPDVEADAEAAVFAGLRPFFADEEDYDEDVVYDVKMPTVEDLAEIGPFDPVPRPGRRYVGRHRAQPSDFEETT